MPDACINECALEYPDSSPIEELVTDTAVATNRGMERVNEWLSLLRRQDIMNVGDLRGLHDEDWVSLYVSALRDLCTR